MAGPAYVWYNPSAAAQLLAAGGVVHEAEANLTGVATYTIDGSFVGGGDLSGQAVATFTSEGVAGPPQRREVRIGRGGRRRGRGGAYWSRPRSLYVVAAVGVVHEGEASLQAVATFTSDGQVALLGESSVTGVATYASDGAVGLLGESSLQAVATFTPDGVLTLGGALSPIAVATFTSDGIRGVLGESSLQAVATLQAEGEIVAEIHEGEATLQAVGTTTPDGSFVGGGALAGQAVAIYTSEGFVTIQGESSVVGVATYTVDGSVAGQGETSQQAVATYISDGMAVLGGEASLQAVTTFTSEGEPVYPRLRVTRQRFSRHRRGSAVYISRSRQVPSIGPVDHQAEATLQAVATTDAEGAVGLLGETTQVAVATLTAEVETGLEQRRETRVYRRSSRRNRGAVYVSRPRLIPPVGQLVHEAEATLQAVASFDPEAAVAFLAEASFQGVAAITADVSELQRRETRRYGVRRRRGGAAYVSRPRVATPPSLVVHQAEATLQAVATSDSDGSVSSHGEMSLQSVATFDHEGVLVLLGEVLQIAVATLTSDAVTTPEGEASLVGVATFSVEAAPTFGGAASLVGVATLESDAQLIVASAEVLFDAVAILRAEEETVTAEEAILVGVAHMGFDPQHSPRSTSWYVGARGSFYGNNRRRVRGGGRQTSGGRVNR